MDEQTIYQAARDDYVTALEERVELLEWKLDRMKGERDRARELACNMLAQYQIPEYVSPFEPEGTPLPGPAER